MKSWCQTTGSKFAAGNCFICLHLKPITIRRSYFDKRQSNPR